MVYWLFIFRCWNARSFDYDHWFSRYLSKFVYFVCCSISFFEFLGVNAMRKSNIESREFLSYQESNHRSDLGYDLGDLQYGVSNVYYPPNTYLSDANKAAVQKYVCQTILSFLFPLAHYFSCPINYVMNRVFVV